MENSERPICSVIISSYNKFNFLERVLAGFENQSFKGFEVVIADDGSNEETVSQLRNYIKTSKFPIKHVWHEDNGFRKTTILNKALKAAKADYLIFIDGDCIPHRCFVEAHIRHRRPDTVLAGRRVLLSESISDQLTVENIRNGKADRLLLPLLSASFSGEVQHVEKAFFLDYPLIRKLPVFNHDTWLLGCNFSLYRKDIEEVNGFDERYTAPEFGEDIDLELRLRWQKKKIRSIKNFAIQYHLYHVLVTRRPSSKELFDQINASKVAFTPAGLIKVSDKNKQQD